MGVQVSGGKDHHVVAVLVLLNNLLIVSSCGKAVAAAGPRTLPDDATGSVRRRRPSPGNEITTTQRLGDDLSRRPPEPG
jgi:hypothetical protein